MRDYTAMKFTDDKNVADRAGAWPSDPNTDAPDTTAVDATGNTIAAASQASEAAASSASGTDPLSLYMSEIGEVDLLTKDDEVRLAKVMDDARVQVRECLFRLPMSVHFVEGAASRLRDGNMSLRDVLATSRDEEEPARDDRLQDFLKQVARIRRMARVKAVGQASERSRERIATRLHELGLANKTVIRMADKLEEAGGLVRTSRRLIKRAEKRTGLTSKQILTGRGASVKGKVTAELKTKVAEATIAIDEIVEAVGASEEEILSAIKTVAAERKRFAAAREHFVRANVRLVVSLAKRYSNFGLPLGDLIQEGNIGLMYAVDRFDHRVGCRFSTYAVHWIRQAISGVLQTQTRPVSVPRYMREVIVKVQRTMRELRDENGCEPGVDEIAEVSGVPCDKVRDVKDLTLKPMSLDETIGDVDERTLHDVVEDHKIPGPEAVADVDLDGRILALVGSFREREAEVLRMRFGLGGATDYSLDEVGTCFGLSRERVRQIEGQALRRLRLRR